MTPVDRRHDDGTPGRLDGVSNGPLLRLNGLTKRYPGVTALDDITLELPAGRIGDAEDFGAACAWLCSTQAGFITGQNWLVDGGAYTGTF